MKFTNKTLALALRSFMTVRPTLAVTALTLLPGASMSQTISDPSLKKMTPAEVAAKIAESNKKVDDINKRQVQGATPEALYKAVLDRAAAANASGSQNEVDNTAIQKEYVAAKARYEESLKEKDGKAALDGGTTNTKKFDAALSEFKAASDGFKSSSDSSTKSYVDLKTQSSKELAAVSSIATVLSGKPAMQPLFDTIVRLEATIGRLVTIRTGLGSVRSTLGSTTATFEKTTQTFATTTALIDAAALDVKKASDKLKTYTDELSKTTAGFKGTTAQIAVTRAKLDQTVVELTAINDSISSKVNALDAASTSIEAEAKTLTGLLVQSRQNSAAFEKIYNQNEIDLNQLQGDINLLKTLSALVSDAKLKADILATLQRQQASLSSLISNQGLFAVEIQKYKTLIDAQQKAVNTIIARAAQVKEIASNLRELSVKQAAIITRQKALSANLVKTEVAQNGLVANQERILKDQSALVTTLQGVSTNLTKIATTQRSAVTVQLAAVATQKKALAEMDGLLTQLDKVIVDQRKIAADQRLMLVPKCLSLQVSPATVIQGDSVTLIAQAGGYVSKIVLDGTEFSGSSSVANKLAQPDKSMSYSAYVVGAEKGQIVNCAVANVTVKPADFVLLKTPADLEKMRANPAGKFKLANDIDMKGQPRWKALPKFAGTLDGQGFLIKNMEFAETTYTVALPFMGVGNEPMPMKFNAMFATINQAVVRNVKVEAKATKDCQDTSYRYTAALAGIGSFSELRDVDGKVEFHATCSDPDLAPGMTADLVGGLVSVMQLPEPSPSSQSYQVEYQNLKAQLYFSGPAPVMGRVGGLFGHITYNPWLEYPIGTIKLSGLNATVSSEKGSLYSSFYSGGIATEVNFPCANIEVSDFTVDLEAQQLFGEIGVFSLNGYGMSKCPSGKFVFKNGKLTLPARFKSLPEFLAEYGGSARVMVKHMFEGSEIPKVTLSGLSYQYKP